MSKQDLRSKGSTAITRFLQIIFFGIAFASAPPFLVPSGLIVPP